MVTWLAANSDWLNVVANWTMVAIWIVYLQIFLRSFRRQTLPKIVINHAAGSFLGAACFVSNMSSEVIYIESVIIEISGDETFVCAVTDFDHFGNQPEIPDPKQLTFQGPLRSSEYTSLGTFDYLIDMACRRTGRESAVLKRSTETITVTVTILADYASESLLIGARRRFSAHANMNWKLTAENVSTEQIRSRRQRKRIYSTLAQIE